MRNTVFPYPGGKTYMADWIIAHFPDHHCYVEPFGGGGSVIVNKPKSSVEIYNDRDGDVVHFFRVLRNRVDELVEWLNERPYSKDLHEKYGRQYYAGYRPNDDVERAGRFFYLRRSQYAGKYPTMSGFRSSKERNPSTQYYNGVDDLEDFADRFRNVQIENRDYTTILDRFDGQETLFYFDPPYISEGDALYTGEQFDHRRFVDLLGDTEGMWCVSYTDIPDGLEYEYIVTREEPQNMSNAGTRDKEYRTERLLMNYDPSKIPSFEYAGQTSVDDF